MSFAAFKLLYLMHFLVLEFLRTFGYATQSDSQTKKCQQTLQCARKEELSFLTTFLSLSRSISAITFRLLKYVRLSSAHYISFATLKKQMIFVLSSRLSGRKEPYNTY